MKKEGVVIVTGASRGVGRATALALVRDHGRHVLALARDTDALASLQQEALQAGGLLQTLVVDLASEGAERLVSDAIGPRSVAALVNNAGLLLKRELGAWSSEDMLRLYRVNVVAPLLLVQLLADRLAGMPAGHVVNIGSMGGVQGSSKFPGLLGYSASKGALVTVTECLAEEFKERGVSANCLCLGSVDTEMLREAFPGFRAPVSAEEVGAFVARFALEGAKLFNGKTLQVAVGTP
jgi:3-oxoacyl-[acyl-carrier protein] reductase